MKLEKEPFYHRVRDNIVDALKEIGEVPKFDANYEVNLYNAIGHAIENYAKEMAGYDAGWDG